MVRKTIVAQGLFHFSCSQHSLCQIAGSLILGYIGGGLKREQSTVLGSLQDRTAHWSWAESLAELAEMGAKVARGQLFSS